MGALVGGQVVLSLSLSLSLFAHLLFQGPHVLCGLHFCILQKSKKEKEKVDDSHSVRWVGAGAGG